MNKNLKWAFGVAVLVIIGTLIFGPLYRARDETMKVTATSEEAAQKRRDTVAQAEAERDAEIIHAQAVAKANRIIANSLRANARFLLKMQRDAIQENTP